LKDTWESLDHLTLEEVLADIFDHVACCDLEPLFDDLIASIENYNESESIQKRTVLERALMDDTVLFKFRKRFWSTYRFPGDEFDECGLRSILSLYFAIFGQNVIWMQRSSFMVNIVSHIPVEVGKVLEADSNWQYLTPNFEELVRISFEKVNIRNVNQLFLRLHYKTEGEWDWITEKVIVKMTQPNIPVVSGYFNMSCIEAFAGISSILKRCGVKQTIQITKHLWERVPCNASFEGDSIESFGGLLHLAIKLGLLTEVKKRAWPGLIKWTNQFGEHALDLSKSLHGSEHEITRYIQRKWDILNQ